MNDKQARPSNSLFGVEPMPAIELAHTFVITTLERFLVVRALAQSPTGNIDIARARKRLFEAVRGSDWDWAKVASMTIEAKNYGDPYDVRLQRDQLRALLEFCDAQIGHEIGVNAFALIDLRDRLYAIVHPAESCALTAVLSNE